MRFVVGVMVLLPVLLLVVGRLRGRVEVRSCCVAPEHDLRMASAYDDEAATDALRAGRAPG